MSNEGRVSARVTGMTHKAPYYIERSNLNGMSAAEEPTTNPSMSSEDIEPSGPLHISTKKQMRNKEAQQRYRAKHKAEFETMKLQLEELTIQANHLQSEQQARMQLELEVVALRNLIAEQSAQLNPCNQPAFEVYESLNTFHMQLEQLSSIIRLDVAVKQPQDTQQYLSISQTLTELTTKGLDITKSLLHCEDTKVSKVLAGLSPSIDDSATPFLATQAAAADDPECWNKLMIQLHLSADQMGLVHGEQGKLIDVLDVIYGERLLLKTQFMFKVAGVDDGSGGGGDATTTTAAINDAQHSIDNCYEVDLLENAKNLGFAVNSQALVTQTALLTSLKDSVAKEKEALQAMLATVLTQILSPAQSCMYMLLSHPFGWNILAFSHAVRRKLEELAGGDGGVGL